MYKKDKKRCISSNPLQTTIHMAYVHYVPSCSCSGREKQEHRLHYRAFSQPPTKLTFHHDHVDIYGTDWRLRQSLPFLQDPGYVSGRNPIVRFGPECHQLPNGYTYRERRASWYVSVWWAVIHFVFALNNGGRNEEWQNVSLSNVTWYQNSYVDKLAVPAGVGVSRMHLHAGGTEERKRRKGRLSLLPGSVDAFAILSGRHDQTLGKRQFGSWPTQESCAVFGFCAGICACVCSWTGGTVYVGWGNDLVWCDIVHLRLPVCRCGLPMSWKSQMLARYSAFFFFKCWQVLIRSKNNILSEASKQPSSLCRTHCWNTLFSNE